MTSEAVFVARISRRWLQRHVRKALELCHSGPVAITTGGKDTHVLMTEAKWLALGGKAEPRHDERD